MTNLIGKRRTKAHSCTAKVHLANCYNPGLDLTACVCGQVWWRGQVGVWRSRQLRRTTGFTTSGNPITEVTGWDRYFLHLVECGSDDVNPAPGHVCRDAAPMTADEAFGRTPVAEPAA